MDPATKRYHRDLMHLKSAKGWQALGNYMEATAELRRISAPMRTHPDVLELRCLLFEATGQLRYSLAIAQTLAERDPERLGAWLCQARCHYRMGDLQKAVRLLKEIRKRFPQEAIEIPELEAINNGSQEAGGFSPNARRASQ